MHIFFPNISIFHFSVKGHKCRGSNADFSKGFFFLIVFSNQLQNQRYSFCIAANHKQAENPNVEDGGHRIIVV